MSECPVCFTTIHSQLHWADHWDTDGPPTHNIFSCSYGCTSWMEPLTDQEAWEWYYFQSGDAYRRRVAGWASGEDDNGRFFVVFARVPDWVLHDADALADSEDDPTTRRYENVTPASQARFHAVVRDIMYKSLDAWKKKLAWQVIDNQINAKGGDD